MANLTRILNNQIFNSTIIASQKIAAGTITGSLFASNVTVPGDLLIAGNLFVLGTSAYTTIASTNTYVNDPLVTLNNGFAGTNTYDEGVVFNRGSLLNQAFIWSEFNKEFRLVGTTETGTTYGNVAVSNFANLHIGNLTVDYTLTTTGNFITTGFINTSGNISAAVGLFGAINSTGLINTTGNVSASQVSVATLNATGLINTLGNISASQGSFATVNATGLINTTGNLSAATVDAATINASGNVVATVFNGGAVNVSGNVLASTVLAQLVTADDATFGNVDAGFIGNTGTAFTGASINLSGNVLAAGGIYNALTVNGNETVTGNLNVTGNILGSAGTLNTLAINSTTNATETTGSSGALQIKGGVSIAKDVQIGGNLYVSNIFATSYNVLTVNDPLLYLTAANTFPYNYEIGFYSQFVGGAGNIYQHSGVVRDHNDAYWKFFSNSVAEPTATITFDADTIYDGIKAGNLVLTGTGVAISAAGLINTTANISAAVGNFGAVNSTGFINTTGNISGAVINGGAINSTGLINTTGNISAATVIAGQFNTTGNLVASQVSTGTLNATGLINTTGNISAATVIAGQFNTTGNLVAAEVSTSTLNATGLINTLGNISASRINADTLAATGTIWANAATDTTSLTTGALIVAGGAAVGKTMWVGEGMRINSTQAAETFHVLGQGTNNSLIYADLAKNAIVFGGANAAVQDGAVVKFNSPGAIVLPVGTSAQRPGSAGNVDVTGMIRFSSTVNNLEFYDGAEWQTAGTSFTVISDRQFVGNVAGGFGNVDGTNTVFTLQSNSTTAGTLISINGVVQFPILAYSVTNNQLTFTEAPAPDDVIDARIFTTTTELTSLASSSGLNQFIAADAGAQIWSGIGTTTQRIEVDTAGDLNLLNGTDIVYTQTAVNIAANNTPYVIATRSQTTFTSGKLIVTAKRGTGATGNVETYEAQVVTDGAGNAYITTYGVINNGYTMGGLTANVLAGNVQVYYTGSIASAVVQANVKCFGTFIV